MRAPASQPLLLVIALVVGLGAGCGGSDRAVVVPVDPVGSWSGTTSQGHSFTFQVGGGGTTSASLAWDFSGSSCSYYATATFSSASPVLDANNAFTWTLLLDPYTRLTVNGRFTSASAASGSFQIADSYCVGTLNGTWSASRL